ncbi:hypothetical protein C8F04DRAFT_1241643 [Mycena alexandri]|uniref:Zn(2)-C6 fungal-type domain-containing protein n=1 Tax=Mycena alexandri TaxID=1745969 RepID=A0AAD6S851_9AGAR|nr:hypothetical protein C8F04DRAFT_1241643 [Mycena alexandri]
MCHHSALSFCFHSSRGFMRLSQAYFSPSLESQTLEAPRASGSLVEPDGNFLERFWRRASELTSRYHDTGHKWISGDEVVKWNTENRHPCQKCANSKSRLCRIEKDNPSCLTCRTLKLGCDRKPQFVFALTKDEFFADYDQFLAIFQNKEPGRLKRYNMQPQLAGPKPPVQRNAVRGWQMYQIPENTSERNEGPRNEEKVGHFVNQDSTSALPVKPNRNHERAAKVTRLEAQVRQSAGRVNDLEAQVLVALKTFASLAPALRNVAQTLERLVNQNEILQVLTPAKGAVLSAAHSIEELCITMNENDIEPSSSAPLQPMLHCFPTFDKVLNIISQRLECY